MAKVVRNSGTAFEESLELDARVNGNE